MNAVTAEPFVLRQALPGEGMDMLPCNEWLFAAPGGLPPKWDEAAALKRLENTLADGNAALIVAESPSDDAASPGGQATVGICSVYIDIESVRYGLRAWVEDLAVAPKRRSGGVGAALLRTAREWSRERGATHLELDSGTRRVDAHRFYERERPAWTGMQYAWQL